MPSANVRPGTGSRTIADMMGAAGAQYADRPLVRHKVDGAWVDVSFAEVGVIVSEIARGLIDLGLAPGERVGDPGQHPPGVDLRRLRDHQRRRGRRPDLPDQLAGGVRLGARATPRPRAVFCEDADAAGQDRSRSASELPAARARDRDRAGATATRSRSTELRERGRGRDASRARRRAREPSRPTTRTRSSTRRAPRARRRAAC